MISAPIPKNEAARLKALQQYKLLDTAPEKSFDDLTLLASYICNCPIAVITLIDQNRQWFKSNVGLTTSETNRDVAFCAHTILQNDPLIVTDATKDQRFYDNPFVLNEPCIRFYAGVPLINAEGFALGSICVIDRKPTELTPQQTSALEALARQTMLQFEMRRVSFDLAEALEQVKTLQGLLPICAHCKKIRDDKGYWSQVETYVSTRSEAEFSHGICPTCIAINYPELNDVVTKKPA